MNGPLPLSLFQWFEATWLGEGIRASMWLFPVIEAFHLVAFAVLGGTVLVLDLRLLGLVLREQPVQVIAREARPWFFMSLAAMMLTGFLLFLSETVKLYFNEPFWLKMGFLALAIVFTGTLRRKIAATDPEQVGPLWGRVAAVVSLFLWGGVAWGGRWIGFWG